MEQSREQSLKEKKNYCKYFDFYLKKNNLYKFVYLIEVHTPLRLEFIATTGDHWFALGLYRSAVDNSVASSRPPTASILLYLII